MRYRAAMSLVIEKTEAVPLTVDSDGVIRVSGTRVTLDTLAEAFHQGATAVEITQQYPGLSLADVYSVFGYLLRHQAQISTYLDQRKERRDTVRSENERRFEPQGVRARLLAPRV